MPIVQRELLVSSRKRLTFWSRIGAALAGFLAVFFIVGAEPDVMTAGALGAKLFHWLANAAFWLCLFGGALLTADCLSVEKREGTLGLLFLTDLKGHDVVLGKLVAKSLTAVFCLIAIIPMLAVPILLGGVTGGDFWRVTLFLLNTLFVSLCLGMVVSVFSRESRNATAVAVFAVLLWLLLPMIVSSLIPVRGRVFVNVLSPSVPWSHAFSAMPGRRFGVFAVALLLQHLLGWICLAVASRHAQASWHEHQKSQPWRERSHEFLRGDAEWRLALRRLLLPINPLLWLESRNRMMRGVLVWLFVPAAMICWLLNSHPVFHWSRAEQALGTVLFLHLFIMLLVAFDASTRMVYARRDDTLTMILTTRLDTEDILRGEWLAARRLFGWPALIVMAFDLFWMLGVVAYDRRPAHVLGAAVLVATLVLSLFLHGRALVWTALLYSLRSKRPYRVALRAFAVIVLAPVVWFGLAVLSGPDKWSFLGGVVAFAVLNFVNTWIFGTTAYQRFKTDFREILTEHPRAPEKNFSEDYALLR